MALEITDANFAELVLKSEKPVLVDFWAAWCGPCRMIAPTIDELALENAETAIVGKLDVDANPNISIQYGVRSIPTLLIFKNGEMVDRVVGILPKNVLQEKLSAQMA